VTADQLAALIAAVAFALLACVGVYVLLRLARLISEGAALMSELRTRSDTLLEQAGQAVDQAHEQLARTDAIGANLDVINNNLADLTGDISMLTGTFRAIVSGPAGRIAAFAFGVRRAIGLRRPDGRARPWQRLGDQDQRPALPAGRR
jgi:uncharacterized protein YoxC